MGRLALALLACAASSPVASAQGPDPSREPEWIWAGGGVVDGQRVRLVRDFELARAPKRARVRAAADNAFELWLNGARVLAGERWEEPESGDVVGALRAGVNRIAVLASNAGGPAGFWLELEIEHADGARERVVSDTLWRASSQVPADDTQELAAPDGPPAVSFGAPGSGPWGLPGEPAPPPPAALDESAIEAPPGFAVELVFAVPREFGSWVSLTFDAHGRAWCADQFGALYRVDGLQSGWPAAERLALELGGARGLTFADGALYAVVNGSGEYASRLVRASDEDQDGELDTLCVLATFDGDGEHGPHAIVPEPATRRGTRGPGLWLVCGNHTLLDLPLANARSPRVWDEDHVLPELPDPNGHAVGRRAPGGWIARYDLGDETWELEAHGLRNAYDLAFDAAGELFTYDSDMEWDMGLPWYRPPRILHVTSGAEFGWRTGSGKWPTGYLDSLPAVVDTGPASPTGLLHGSTTNFPPPYDTALFAADWAYGVLHAVHVTAAGASFTGRAETFLAGRPLPIADLAAGPEGALWFVTGGRGVSSGLYRVSARHAAAQPAHATALPRPLAGAPTAAALARRWLEGGHARGHAHTLGALWPWLGHADRHVRFAARVALEQALLAGADRDAAYERADSEARSLARLEALVALARTAAGERGPDGFEITKSTLADEARRFWKLLAALDPARLDDAAGLAFARTVALGLARLGEPDDPVRWRTVLRSVFPSGLDSLDRELFRLLVRLADPEAPALAAQRIAAAVSQEEALHYAFCVRTAGADWTPEARAGLARWLAQAEGLGGGASFAKYVAAIRAELAPHLGDLTPAALAPATDVDRLATVRASSPSSFVRHWSVDDVAARLSDLLRPGTRSFARGRESFERSSCLTCHRFAGVGAASAPDLTGAGGRYSPTDFARAVLEPHAAISDQYRDTLVWTSADELFVGRLVRDDERALELETGDGRNVRLRPEDVLARRTSSVSRMPEGLVDGLTEDELLDLAAYVLTGGDAGHVAFESD